VSSIESPLRNLSSFSRLCSVSRLASLVNVSCHHSNDLTHYDPVLHLDFESSSHLRLSLINVSAGLLITEVDCDPRNNELSSERKAPDAVYARLRSLVIAKIAKAGWEEFSLHRKLASSSGWVGIDQSKI